MCRSHRKSGPLGHKQGAIFAFDAEGGASFSIAHTNDVILAKNSHPSARCSAFPATAIAVLTLVSCLDRRSNSTLHFNVFDYKAHVHAHAHTTCRTRECVF